MVDTIINSFDIWTDAQGLKSRVRVKSIDNISLEGISHLRELILQLGIKGKLVAQNSNDEDASVLIKKISKEKKKLKKKNELLPITKNKTSLPKGWQYERIGNLMDLINGRAFKPNEWSLEGYPIIRIQNLNNRNAPFNYCDFEVDSKFHVKNNDLLIGWSGTPGTSFGAFIWDRGDALLNQHIFKADQYGKLISVEYLRFAINSSLNEMIAKAHGGVGLQHITKAKFEQIELPLPPLAEQKRIVAKVEELMVLCDQLEAQQTHRLKTHQQLVKILLGTLIQAKDVEEVQTAWQQLLPHFDTLFCTEDSIEQLKQTILQLAIMGYLVKQNPKDEPAKELLKKIKKQKEKLIKEGKIKKEKPLLKVKENEKIFQIPQSWEWIRLSEISKLSGGFAYKSSSFITSESKHQVIRMGNIRPDFLRLDESAIFIAEKLGDETAEYRIVEGDILITMTGTKDKRDYLYSVVVRADLNARKLYLNQRLCSIRPILIDPNFLAKMIKDNRILDSIYIQATGTANQANISMGALKNWVLPLPPLAEQQRIIVKIDELMALCDQLKSRITDSQEIQNTLSKTIVENALS